MLLVNKEAVRSEELIRDLFHATDIKRRTITEWPAVKYCLYQIDLQGHHLFVAS